MQDCTTNRTRRECKESVSASLGALGSRLSTGRASPSSSRCRSRSRGFAVISRADDAHSPLARRQAQECADSGGDGGIEGQPTQDRSAVAFQDNAGKAINRQPGRRNRIPQGLRRRHIGGLQAPLPSRLQHLRGSHRREANARCTEWQSSRSPHNASPLTTRPRNPQCVTTIQSVKPRLALLYQNDT